MLGQDELPPVGLVDGIQAGVRREFPGNPKLSKPPQSPGLEISPVELVGQGKKGEKTLFLLILVLPLSAEGLSWVLEVLGGSTWMLGVPTIGLLLGRSQQHGEPRSNVS